MNLVDLLDDEGLQQDEWSLTAPTFGSNGQLTVIGWSGRNQRHKEYVVHCATCAQDYELFGGGYFKSMRGSLNGGKLPCGCSSAPRWTKEQYSVLCSRKAEELGYTFIGFDGEWKGGYTKIKMLCEKHGEWSTGIVLNLIKSSSGCPSCKADTCSSRSSKSDSVMINSFFESKAFHPDTQFHRSDRSDCRGHKVYWLITCPECGEQGEATSSSLQKGSITCGCSTSQPQEAYVNLIIDNTVPVAIKFGIANKSLERASRLNRSSVYEVVNYTVFKFTDSISCKAAERECKLELDCGILPKQDMPDGYTETTYVYNIDKITEIYKKHGGVEV